MKQLTGPILLVGAPEEHPDLEYASGFRAPDPIVFMLVQRKRYLVVSSLEYGRAVKTFARGAGAAPTAVFTPEMLGLKDPARRRIAQWALAVARHAGVTQVVVPANFPYDVAMTLKRGRVAVAVAEGALFPQRAVKTPAEIRMIRESQQAAVIAMRGAIAMIAQASIDSRGQLCLEKRALTSERVQRRIRETLLAHDTFCRDVIVAGGRQGADPHERGHGPLRAGDPVVIDIFPRHLRHGYWGDITRTVVKGPAKPELRRMYLAVRSAQTLALNAIAPRVRCAAVHQIVCDEFERRGYRTVAQDGCYEGFIHSTGHGVGLAIHEAPSLARVETRLAAGQVVTVEPGLYYSELGGIRIEDTVVVTRDGWRLLAPCEKRFEV